VPVLDGQKEDLEQLHIECVRSLRSYMSVANQTCKLLTRIEKFPVSADQRLEILEQRQHENLAFERYRNARNRLFEAARWDDSTRVNHANAG
jgi:hypothetical protein